MRNPRGLVDHNAGVGAAACAVRIVETPELHDATGDELNSALLVRSPCRDWREQRHKLAVGRNQDLVCGREPCDRIPGEGRLEDAIDSERRLPEPAPTTDGVEPTR